MDPVSRTIVGREHTLAAAAALLEAARAGRGRVALLLGEAGIGKTTLARALADRAESAGMAAVWCWCAADNPLPYFPWRPLLRHLDLPGAAGATQSIDRQHFFGSVLDGLEAASRDRAVLIVLDDANWADPGSLALLRMLAGGIPGMPVCLVATSRDVLPGLSSEVLRLRLDPLRTNEIATILAEVTGQVPADSVAAGVLERTGGNPFLVQEVARGLTAEPPETLPQGARELITRQVERLAEDSQRALLAAALCSGGIDESLVGELLGVAEARAVELLDAAADARLLIADPGGGFRFVHALVSEVVLANAPAALLARWHEQIATALERRGGVEPGTLARHWSLAVGPKSRERAAHWSVAQAREARRHLGFEQAASAYRQALSLPGEERLDLLLELAECQWLAGDPAGSRSTYLDVAWRAGQSGSAETLALAALGLGGGVTGFEVALRDDEQVQLLREALAALPPGDGSLRAAVAARLSVALTELAPDAERAALAEEAVAIADRLAHAATTADPMVDAVRVAALAAYCDALAGPGYVAERLDAAVRMRAIADAAGDHVGRLLARRLAVVALLERGEFAAADAEGAAYARIAARLGVSRYLWLPSIWSGRQACLRGDLETARAAADAAERFGRRAASQNAMFMVAALRWNIYRMDGSLSARRPELLAAFADILDVPSTFGAQAECAVAVGDLDEARRMVRAAVAVGLQAMPLDSEWLGGIVCIGQCAIDVGDVDAARLAYAALKPFPGVFAVEGLAAAVHEVTDVTMGKLAAFLGDRPAARAHLEAGLAAHERTGSPVLAEAAARELARLDRGRPHREQPAAAQAIFQRAGRLWQITYAGQSAIVPDSKGMADLAKLLSSPGTEVHVLDLVDSTGLARAAGTPADEVIDATARTAYQTRLRELEDEVAEAEAQADLGRAEHLRSEREFLAAELGAALGLGGRVRTAADPAERARKAVGMRISAAIRAVDAVHRPLARHLKLAVQTGRFCSYRPEHPVRWQV